MRERIVSVQYYQRSVFSQVVLNTNSSCRGYFFHFSGASFICVALIKAHTLHKLRRSFAMAY